MSFERDARCKHGETNPGGSGGCAECHAEEFGDPFENVLLPHQKAHWASIQWFVNFDIRGEGRSTLLALAFIQQADKHVGKAIPLWDHFDANPMTRVYTHERITQFLTWFAEEYPGWDKKRFAIDKGRHTLTRIE